MEILAKIPALTERPPSDVVDAPPPRSRRRPTTASSMQWLLDTRTMVTLAALAAMVWSLAAWSEQARLSQQRRSARMASQPRSIVAPETVSP